VADQQRQKMDEERKKQMDFLKASKDSMSRSRDDYDDDDDEDNDIKMTKLER
jgi:hypothetical protein